MKAIENFLADLISDHCRRNSWVQLDEEKDKDGSGFFQVQVIQDNAKPRRFTLPPPRTPRFFHNNKNQGRKKKRSHSVPSLDHPTTPLTPKIRGWDETSLESSPLICDSRWDSHCSCSALNLLPKKDSPPARRHSITSASTSSTTTMDSSSSSSSSSTEESPGPRRFQGLRVPKRRLSNEAPTTTTNPQSTSNHNPSQLPVSIQPHTEWTALADWDDDDLVDFKLQHQVVAEPTTFDHRNNNHGIVAMQLILVDAPTI